MNKKMMISFLFILLSPVLFAAGLSETETLSPRGENNHTVSLRDYSGREMDIALPITKIVTMNSGLSEIVAALGSADLVVGRCSYSTFPKALRSKKVVGKNSSSPNMETIMELEPDLVIADSMFDTNKIEMLNRRGIAVIIESTSNPDRLPVILENLGRVLEKEERANELIGILDETLRKVRQKVEQIHLNGITSPSVFFENRKPYKSASKATGHHQFIEMAGGINIAAEEPVKSPQLSPEFIAMNNPQVIIRRVSGDVNEEALQNMINSIYDRPSLRSVAALANKRVYTVKSDLFISLRYPVGVAYFASLFYPDQFSLEEVDAIHRDFIVKLYGIDEWNGIRETYVYPR